MRILTEENLTPNLNSKDFAEITLADNEVEEATNKVEAMVKALDEVGVMINKQINEYGRIAPELMRDIRNLYDAFDFPIDERI